MTPDASNVPSAYDLNLRELFERYHAAWESADPERIAGLHSADTTFWLQDGSPRISGRDAVRDNIAGLFKQYGKLGWDIRRVMFGERHWVFDYEMLIGLKDRDGKPFTARVPMVDIVDVNDLGEVTRKDVFMDASARKEALERAGFL